MSPLPTSRGAMACSARDLHALRPGADASPLGATPAVSLRDIRFRYAADRPLVLAIEHLSVEPGERIAVVGPSGSGKTTLLRLLNGSLRAASGEVLVLGQRLLSGRRQRREQRRRIGMVYQDFALVERASVLDNALYGRLGYAHPWLSLIGRFSAEDRERAEAAVREVGLEDEIDQRVDALSGGQRQRVAIARVLAQEPALILADEPISSLDPALTEGILNLLVEACERRGATLIMSLHQPQLARQHADRAIGISGGRIVFDGPTDRLTPQALHDVYGTALTGEARPHMA
jgi:phosphonate transport system ATP-binding protein